MPHRSATACRDVADPCSVSPPCLDRRVPRVSRGDRMKLVARSLIMTAVSLAVSVAWSQDPGWPRVVRDGGTQVVVFQPQPDSLDGVTLHSRVAVSIKGPQDQAPLFGALWVTATLDVNRDKDL